ncbi:hypothetical protein [Ferribacterium limneticum]|uniref:hypothetical protein n=1 Tax=Ferribacterium limneticum TaxID=76259 RepID=UPI001CF9EF84|nr:hypothetical protein [Ferribacterium limneticum]UCV30351.1 hypothetical protein KI617_09875 [Ferribacterium limneticum]UCV34269.1 hypothetical protein KI608_09875 [Ferribacterium limneticum]
MIYLHAALSQQFAPANLPGAVRATLGKPLRRAAGLTQLALVGAFACLPEERRHLPTALLWQSTSGPRLETITLLEEICDGAAEPMPYDFLATQPAIAAAQIQPMLPGLQSAMHIPLDSENSTNWSLLLNLAIEWLNEGRYAQVLCAQLDHWAERSSGHWLCVGTEPLENSLTSLQIVTEPSPDAHADTSDFPARLSDWLNHGDTATLSLHSTAAPQLAVEFARL